MGAPTAAAAEMARILKPSDLSFIDVDLGGIPPPDGPVIFTAGSLAKLVETHFRTLAQRDRDTSHRRHSPARRELPLEPCTGYQSPQLDRDALLSQYLKRYEEGS